MQSEVVSRYSIVPNYLGVHRRRGRKTEILMGSGCIANLDSVLFEGFMGNGFAASKNLPGFPTRILGPELIDKFHEQSLRFGARIITEIISRTDLSAPSVPMLRLGLKGEETYWQSGISACAVCDGAVPIFRNKPLAVIGASDSGAEEATSTECQGDGSLLKNLWTRNAQTGSEKNLAANGLFYATNPQQRSFRTQLQTDPDGYVVTRFFAAQDVQEKSDRQAVTTETPLERLIAEEEGKKEMMGVGERV
ncbi:hypothetical protein K435DRAFT_824597 [Dendrothele bispora CBS 962.96]|uniref:Uncharacterized protein n=1 Tax=Dendrothele bispora (strain CBS 962.96) TaxID=1314807 RepID=A0A4V4HAP0_DENBC|nr:hypothetical protein K435DRAFT_824597 [Dendrothele bispora CBS 962.96]